MKKIYGIYIVTTEIKTPLWKKVLRFLRLYAQREDFSLYLGTALLKKGDILHTGNHTYIKIIKVEF